MWHECNINHLCVCRCVVFVAAGVWLLSSAHPTVGAHRQTESTDQRGSEVRLAACYSGHVHQQVQTEIQRHAFHNNHIEIIYALK